MKYLYPYQLLTAVKVSSGHGRMREILVAASGPSLYSFDIPNSQYLGQWTARNPPPVSLVTGDEDEGSAKKADQGKNKADPPNEGRATKKRKLSTGHVDSPYILSLESVNDDAFVATASDTDKCVRVFKIGGEGQIRLISERDFLFCGDKFGDVYSLDFPTSTAQEQHTQEEDHGSTAPIDMLEPSESLTLAASERTVHTGRNRAALRDQQQSRATRVPKAPSAGEHALLLGHVSMLTDLKTISAQEMDSRVGHNRLYLVSSDRDEHIRVSRGPPQSHIIENFCLGHKSFVSRLCVPAFDQSLLLSGDGDGHVLVWDWAESRVTQKLDIPTLIKQCTLKESEHRESYAIDSLESSHKVEQSESDGLKFPISILYAAQFQDPAKQHEDSTKGTPNSRHDYDQVLIFVDRLAYLFIYNFSETSGFTHQQTIPLKGNALSLVSILGNSSILVSIDTGRYLPEYHEAKGNRDFFECCRSPEIASTLTLQPIDRYDGLLDAAIIFSDILVIPQAMGMTVEMVDGKGPHFPDPLKSPEDAQFKELMTREVNVKEELNYVYEAITLTRKKLEGRVPLIGFCGAPWTLLCYMVEGGGSKLFIQVKTWLFRFPKESKQLLQKIAELCVDYLALQVVAGAQLIQVFDSWASELSPASFQDFALPYLNYISDNLPKRLEKLGKERVPMIVFAKGAWYALEPLCGSRYDVVGLDWLYDPLAARTLARERVVLQGNADPGVLYGTEAAITEVVSNMVQGFGGGKGGWIANLGHGVTPRVDPERLRFFLKEIHRVGGA
ncbi:MAG: Uroporphyrinogen decarboxylase in heme biosynthesis [Vezdaea aestivalis]|nr:MAG: Uroporphyrinogen decarboxylase in heme biosynthesis [Vezdaea aestivalis]